MSEMVGAARKCITVRESFHEIRETHETQIRNLSCGGVTDRSDMK
jgi:hypothetical protein